MSLQLFELSSWRTGRREAVHGPTYHVRPAVESLEERTVMSSPASVASALAAAAHHSASLLPINITSVQVVNGALQAVGTAGGQAFTALLTFPPSPPPAGSDCPILNLHLDPIHLNLLGLKVDTSAICLDITAHQGEGLLGDLLCGVSHLLDGGTPLSTILAGLTSTDLTNLTGGLTRLLNGGLGALGNPANASVTGATRDILNLSVGPLDLNLLGLEVALDNCNNGPVTIDISAQPGAGNLLGNLLSRVSHLLDHGANIHALDNALSHLARDIDRLV